VAAQDNKEEAPEVVRSPRTEARLKTEDDQANLLALEIKRTEARQSVLRLWAWVPEHTDSRLQLRISAAGCDGGPRRISEAAEGTAASTNSTKDSKIPEVREGQEEVPEAQVIQLEVHEGRTFFTGKERELKQMFKCLRVPDKNAYWKATAILRRLAFFRGMDEEERNERIEQIKEEAQYIKFYDRRTDSFASGLLPRVVRFLGEKQIACKVRDQRRPVPVSASHFRQLRFRDAVEVRPEQNDVIRKALDKGRGILNCATNFGKTEVACALIAEYIQQTREVPRVLFLIHRKGLVVQTLRRFQKHLGDPETMEGIRVGKKEIVVPVNMIGGGEKRVPISGVLVATTQTSSNLLQRRVLDFRQFLQQCDILFVDEFHLNKAWQASRIVDQCAAPMRFGLSGTIDKKNRVKMLHYIGMTGPIIAEVRNKELVDLGRSAKPFIRMVEVHAPRVEGKYAECYREGIVRCPRRNRLVIREIFRHVNKERRTLVTVARISHGHRLVELLGKKTDVPIEFIWGKTAMSNRDRSIKRFESGKSPILIASPIFDVGMDVPAIEAWVNAAGGVGWELVLQRLGRVLRRKKGRNRVYISDFVDLHNTKYLMKHSVARMKYYVDEEIAEIKIIDRGKP
jgi:superfamily II DNA or RNA helicase